MDIDAANKTAVERMMAARPMLTGLEPARSVIPYTPGRPSNGSACLGRCEAL
jgi:hypothetical protein